MAQFDPNAASTADSGLFGLPFTEADSALVIIPVPWEATTSYGGGTSRGPAAVLEASRQVDLFDLEVTRPYEAGLCLLPASPEVGVWNETAKAAAAPIIRAAGQVEGDDHLEHALHLVNDLGAQVNAHVANAVRKQLRAGKLVAVLGGDHSVPFGAFEAIAEKHPSYGILHLDAHSDTRDAFEGFQWSHASIMRNALERIPAITKLVQVGIRDFCEEEYEFCRAQGVRVDVFYDRQVQGRKLEGVSWSTIAREIVSKLPPEVWISFDIDGLDPRFCPNTGTPVPGGLDYPEALYLLSEVVRSGRKIIGFDLNEVSPGAEGQSEWDANVGARLLYKMCALTLVSNGKARFS